MTAQIAPLRLGTPVCFEDRWQGRIAGIDAQDDWEVLNVSIASGFLVAATTIKLPFSSVTSWSDEAVYVAAASVQAFGREIPPLAAPARPLDARLRTSHPGTRFAGLLVRTLDRRGAEVLLSRGGAAYRAGLADISFEGETLTIGVAPEGLAPYYTDAEITERLHRAIREDKWLTADDKRGLELRAENGEVTIAGNVRLRPAREYVRAIATAIRGVTAVHETLKDDIDLETDIGRALDASGLAREAEVFARSSLGEVTLYGSAASPAAAEDIARAVARVPGVRLVKSQLRVRAAA